MLKYTFASQVPCFESWSLHFYDQSCWTRAKYKAVGHTSKMSADDFAINKWRLYSYIYRYRHCWSIVLTFYWFYVWTPCLSCSESVCKGRGTWGHQSEGEGHLCLRSAALVPFPSICARTHTNAPKSDIMLIWSFACKMYNTLYVQTHSYGNIKSNYPSCKKRSKKL